jgi:hypothetical protein
MLLSSVLLIPLLFAPVDTTAVALDTLPAPEAIVDFGATMGPPVAMRSFELSLTQGEATRARRKAPATTRIRFVRAPDALSAPLARRVSTGERLPRVDAELPGGNGASPMLVHLYDVQVVSTRLLLSDERSALLQQRLTLVESIAQITADMQEADRQLSATESLAKQRLSPSLELARARSRAAVLAQRLDVQQRRLALVERDFARWIPTQEEVVLDAARAELDAQ